MTSSTDISDRKALSTVVYAAIVELRKMAEQAHLCPMQWILRGLADKWSESPTGPDSDVRVDIDPFRPAHLWPVQIRMVQSHDQVQLLLNGLSDPDTEFPTGVIELVHLSTWQQIKHRVWRWFRRGSYIENRQVNGLPRRFEDLERWYWEAALPVHPGHVAANWFHLTESMLRAVDATIYESTYEYNHMFHDIRRLGFEAYSRDGRYCIFAAFNTEYVLAMSMFAMEQEVKNHSTTE